MNEVTKAIEKKKAKLVVIASDVEPLELVVWLPALCRKMTVPFCVLRNKSLLGRLTHHKTCAAVALCDTMNEDKNDIDKLCKIFNSN